jgi:uncharacterized protein
MKFKLSKYYHIAEDEEVLPGKKILFATRSGIALEVENSIISDLLQENWESIDIDLLKKFIDYELIVPEEQDELKYLLDFNIENTNDLDTKELILYYSHRQIVN